MTSVIMTPVAMGAVSKQKIHAPNPFEEPIRVLESQLKHAPQKNVLVSFEPDRVSNAQHRRAYCLGSGWGHWYIVGSWNVMAECQEMEGVSGG